MRHGHTRSSCTTTTVSFSSDEDEGSIPFHLFNSIKQQAAGTRHRQAEASSILTDSGASKQGLSPSHPTIPPPQPQPPSVQAFVVKSLFLILSSANPCSRIPNSPSPSAPHVRIKSDATNDALSSLSVTLPACLPACSSFLSFFLPAPSQFLIATRRRPTATTHQSQGSSSLHSFLSPRPFLLLRTTSTAES